MSQKSSDFINFGGWLRNPGQQSGGFKDNVASWKEANLDSNYVSWVLVLFDSTASDAKSEPILRRVHKESLGSANNDPTIAAEKWNGPKLLLSLISWVLGLG